MMLTMTRNKKRRFEVYQYEPATRKKRERERSQKDEAELWKKFEVDRTSIIKRARRDGGMGGS